MQIGPSRHENESIVRISYVCADSCISPVVKLLARSVGVCGFESRFTHYSPICILVSLFFKNIFFGEGGGSRGVGAALIVGNAKPFSIFL